MFSGGRGKVSCIYLLKKKHMHIPPKPNQTKQPNTNIQLNALTAFHCFLVVVSYYAPH